MNGRGEMRAIPERPEFLRDFSRWTQTNPLGQFLAGGFGKVAEDTYWDQPSGYFDRVLAALDMPGLSGIKGALLGIGALAPMAKEALAERMAAREAETLPLQISSRFPTAKKPEFDPAAVHTKSSGLDEARLDPKKFENQVDLMLRTDPALERFQRYPDVEDRAEAMIDHFVNNLDFIYRNMDPAVRERSTHWYPGGNVISTELGAAGGKGPEAGAAVLSALSPKKEWYSNVNLGDRMVDALLNKQDVPWDRAMSETLASYSRGRPGSRMDKAVRNIEGKSLGELTSPDDKGLWIRVFDETHADPSFPIITPEGTRGETAMNLAGTAPLTRAWQSLPAMSAAVESYENPTLDVISNAMGEYHKRRNFYNALAEPGTLRGDAVLDTHAVAANHLSPWGQTAPAVSHNFGSRHDKQLFPELDLPGPGGSSITGMQGTYGIETEPLRIMGERYGIRPMSMQSITWEGVRGLFSNKSPEVKRRVADIWREYGQGRISQEQAQEQIMDLAGGIDVPTWHQP